MISVVTLVSLVSVNIKRHRSDQSIGPVVATVARGRENQVLATVAAKPTTAAAASAQRHVGGGGDGVVGIGGRVGSSLRRRRRYSSRRSSRLSGY